MNASTQFISEIKVSEDPRQYIIEASQKINPRMFSRVLKEAYCDLFVKNVFDDIFTEYQTNDFSFLMNWARGEIAQCPQCGKWFISAKRGKRKPKFCCAKCSNQWIGEHKSEEAKKACADGVRNMSDSKRKIRNEHFSETMKKKGKDHPSCQHIAHYECLRDKEFILDNFVIKNRFDIEKFMEYFNVDTNIVNKIKKELDISYPNIIHKHKNQNLLFDWIPCDDKRSDVRDLIPNKEIDIVIPHIKLAIEYDGVYYHVRHDEKYHINKTIECENIGYRLFHIFDTDDLSIWKSMIANKLHLNHRIFARKCIISAISGADAEKFLSENHLQGDVKSQIKYGLFFNNELIEVMTFGKPRFNREYQWELLRLCTKKGYCVVGGASKLFNYFIKKHNPQSIISYANRRFSCGEIYEQLGFKFLRSTKPNYFYYKDHKLYSRNVFQKHKLSFAHDLDIVNAYHKDKTERQIMQEAGYSILYDCGNLVYEYKKGRQMPPIAKVM